jgi:hypothetical protein
MLKWAVTFIVNRLVVLAAILFAVNTFGKTTCEAGGSSFGEDFGKALIGLKEISRVLDDTR